MCWANSRINLNEELGGHSSSKNSFGQISMLPVTAVNGEFPDSLGIARMPKRTIGSDLKGQSQLSISLELR